MSREYKYYYYFPEFLNLTSLITNLISLVDLSGSKTLSLFTKKKKLCPFSYGGNLLYATYEGLCFLLLLPSTFISVVFYRRMYDNVQLLSLIFLIIYYKK
jgi:hypothetical protein